MTVLPDSATKACPKCGQANRVSAKNCSHCGTPFFLARVSGELRKRCPHCAFYNRDNAKVCTRCGGKYQALLTAARGQIQKWCSQCGAPRRMSAKVCNQCGFHFASRRITPIVEPPDVLIQTTPPTSTTPRPSYDKSGEPAPFITADEIERLRRKGNTREGLLKRLLRALWGDS